MRMWWGVQSGICLPYEWKINPCIPYLAEIITKPVFKFQQKALSHKYNFVFLALFWPDLLIYLTWKIDWLPAYLVWLKEGICLIDWYEMERLAQILSVQDVMSAVIGENERWNLIGWWWFETSSVIGWSGMWCHWWFSYWQSAGDSKVSIWAWHVIC